MRKLLLRKCRRGLALSAFGIAAISAAYAQTPSSFDIPEQDLATALETFAKQSKVEVLFNLEQTRGKHSSPIKGELDPAAALNALLGGIDLPIRKINDSTFVIGSSPVRTGTPTTKLKDDSWSIALLAQTEGAGAFENSKNDGSSGSQDETLEEVLVTAQKREERLQDVPISISVLSGRNLERPSVASVADALSTIPGVFFAEGGQSGGGTVTIRGVAPNGPLYFGASTVGYYLDTLPFGLVGQGFSPDSNAYDLERVEVLRGPQGTLYGASALNGVVRVLTANPNLDDFEMKARATASTTDGGDPSYRGDAALNLPIVAGKLAARFVAGYEDRGGWIDAPFMNKTDTNDVSVANYRLKLKAQPTDNLTVNLGAWFSRDDRTLVVGDEEKNSLAFVDQPVLVNYDVYGLTIGYDFNAFSLASATSFMTLENESVADFSFVLPPEARPAYISTRNEADVFSQEVTLSSNQLGPWRWALGAIYRDDQEKLTQRVNAPPPEEGYELASKSFAVFGEVTRALGHFELTAGLRYFEDEVRQHEHPSLVLPGDIGDGEENFDALTPRLILSWRPADDAMMYASYSEGFRSGNVGYSFTRAAGIPPLDPDTLRNYELGARGDLFQDRIRYDLAVFYIDWQDIQQSRTIPSPLDPNTQVSAIINGESASGLGVDFGVATSPMAGLNLALNVGWNDLTLDSPLISSGLALANAGDRIAFSPEYTVAVSAEYSFALGGEYRGRLSAVANYTSKLDDRAIFGFDPQRVVTAAGDEIFLGRGSFTVEAPQNWSATLFVNNISNEYGATTRGAYGKELGLDVNSRPNPRTIGVQLEYRYGK